MNEMTKSAKNLQRPGGLILTDYAVRKAGLTKDSKVLDIGCGDGATVKYLNNVLNISAVGIDNDKKAIERGKNDGANIKFGDAFMLDFPSCQFDAVIMENVFTSLARQEESIHEAYCMLKPGGKLIISDVYCREPDMERFAKERKEAFALFYRPRVHSDCGSDEVLPSPYCQDGAVVLDGLYGLMADLDLTIGLCEDHTELLDKFLSQAVADCGSIENYFAKDGAWVNRACTTRRDAGYFLMIADKK